jgi:hypothetical protein
MKESSPVFSVLSMVCSLGILVLVVVAALPPHPPAPVVWAGALSGASAVFLSWGLERLSPRARTALRWVGALVALALGALALVKFGG